MQLARLNKNVVKVIRLDNDGPGLISPTVVYEKPKAKRKKMSKPLRPVEKAMRRIASAESAFAGAYLDKHNRSNEKNKDGWARDIIPNLVKAADKGKKKLRISRITLN